MWTAAGAITSAIALSETFNALSQGVVEMQENPYDMINAKELTILGTRHQYQKFPEVVKILPDHLKEVDEITTHVFKAEDFQKAFDTLADRNSGAGKVVLTFVIEKDGRLTNIQVLQTPDRSLSEEAIRVLQQSPKWSPGKQRNQPVRVRYTLPVEFRIQQ